MSSGLSGGGGGGGGGGTAGAGTETGGGVGAVPGSGMGGVVGVPVSICTHDDRSKNMNSSAFSCALRSMGPVQPPGKPGAPGCELSPAPSDTCTSVNTTRPHWFAADVSTGVLNVRYCVVAGLVV